MRLSYLITGYGIEEPLLEGEFRFPAEKLLGSSKLVVKLVVSISMLPCLPHRIPLKRPLLSVPLCYVSLWGGHNDNMSVFLWLLKLNECSSLCTDCWDVFCFYLLLSIATHTYFCHWLSWRTRSQSLHLPVSCTTSWWQGWSLVFSSLCSCPSSATDRCYRSLFSQL